MRLRRCSLDYRRIFRKRGVLSPCSILTVLCTVLLFFMKHSFLNPRKFAGFACVCIDVLSITAALVANTGGRVPALIKSLTLYVSDLCTNDAT